MSATSHKLTVSDDDGCQDDHDSDQVQDDNPNESGIAGSASSISISGAKDEATDIQEQECTQELSNIVNDGKEDKAGKENEEKDEEDEEGLLKRGYDVIICGTGLTQSILASALTRAGKSVLHCDNNDFYGDLDSVFSLDGLIHWSEQMQTTTDKMKGEDKDGDNGKDGLNGSVNILLEPTEGRSKIKIHSMSNPFSYEQFQSQERYLKDGMKVITPYGEGTVLKIPTTCNVAENSCLSLPVQLDKWTMADGKSPIAYFGYTYNVLDGDDDSVEKLTKYMEARHEIMPLAIYQDRFQYQTYIQSQKRNFALDISPTLLYANGPAVSGMIDSGVAEYCEFKSIIGLEVLTTTNKKNGEKRSRKTKKNENASKEGDTKKQEAATATTKQPSVLSRVPCSKRDVFQTKLLSPVDKRRLMKFLQIASDYAVAADSIISGTSDEQDQEGSTSTPDIVDVSSIMDENGGANNINMNVNKNMDGVEAEVVTSLNERQLQQGRSLYRPQNKSVATTDLEILKKCMKEGMAFDTYLKLHHKLSDHMVNIIIYAMAMGHGSIHNHDNNVDGGTNESKNSRDITTENHCNNTAIFYSTKDGMHDLCQHLQSLGKFGGTAFLVPLYGSGELSQAFCRSAAVHGGTYLLRRGATQIVLHDDDDDRRQCDNGSGKVSGIILNGCTYDGEEHIPQKHIIGSNIVVPSKMLLSSSSTSSSNNDTIRVFRRISILRGKLMLANIESSKVEEHISEQRHVIIIPPGNETIGNDGVIHGIALDESVSVGPRSVDGFEMTVLHLTTTSKCNCDNGESGIAIGNKMLRDAVEDLVRCRQQAGPSVANQQDVKELFHLSFSYEVHGGRDGQKSIDVKDVKGLHVCQDRTMSLTVDTAFEDAARLFHEICCDTSSKSFLKLSEKMDELVKERRFGQDDEDDDEVKILESALDMMKMTNENT